MVEFGPLTFTFTRALFLSFYSRFAATVERHRRQETAFNPYQKDSIIRIMAYFFAYFRPNCHDILILMCCPHHLRGSLEEKLKEQSVTFDSASSSERMKPEDKVYYWVSGGIRPYKKDRHRHLL